MSPGVQTRVLVLGGTGMLGHMVVRHLSSIPDSAISWTTRDVGGGGIAFDTTSGEKVLSDLLGRHGPFRWVVNCIGILRSSIDERDPTSVAVADAVNGTFPHLLAAVAAAEGARVIHISTDAVFPSRAGRCVESTPTSPEDAYARSKRAGEVIATNVLNLRCSIIGPDPRHRRGLLEWLLAQPAKCRLKGFTDQQWVGATTLQVAELCRVLIADGLFHAAHNEGPIHHFCPSAPLSKYELLRLLAELWRPDLSVDPASSGCPVTRVLDTRYRTLREAMGWARPIDLALRDLADVYN